MSRFNSWTTIHAFVVLIGATLSLTGEHLRYVIFAGTGSFMFLVLIARKSWSPVGHFGAANWVTLSRLLGACIIGLFAFSLPNSIISIFGFILLISDGIDGWLASRLELTSEFGEIFDKETDAFFLLLICMIMIRKNLLGPWILITGILRYVFVLTLRWKKPGNQTEIKSRQARLIYVIVTGSLLISMLPFHHLRLGFTLGATLLILYSFFNDFKWLFSRK